MKLPTPTISVTSGNISSATIQFPVPVAFTAIRIERQRADGKWIPWADKLTGPGFAVDSPDFVGVRGYEMSYRAKTIPQGANNPNTESDYSPVVSCVIGTPSANVTGVDMAAVRALVAQLVKAVNP